MFPWPQSSPPLPNICPIALPPPARSAPISAPGAAPTPAPIAPTAAPPAAPSPAAFKTSPQLNLPLLLPLL